MPNLSPTAANEKFTFSPLANPSLKLQYWDEEAYVTELLLEAPDQAGNATQAVQLILAENEGLKSAAGDDKAKKRKTQTEPSASSKKATPSHLQFWSNRHAELHGLQRKRTNSDPSSPSSDAQNPPSRSYADPIRYCCYLCMRQFTSSAEVNKHERLSELHRTNLKDEAKVKRARHKLEKHNITAESQGVTSQQQTEESKQEYRDRAKERRKIYGVVNKKGEQVGTSSNSKEKAPSPPPAAPPSKGANLLAKMGYTGAGLGASGEGMNAPLQQDVYAAGVGLGAQGGKLGDAIEQAERNTKGDYGEWVAQGRDKMRERYKNM